MPLRYIQQISIWTVFCFFFIIIDIWKGFESTKAVLYSYFEFRKEKQKTSVGVFGKDSKHNIWMLFKDSGSRRMLPCVLLFIFDRICHVNSLLHSWWGCFCCTDPTQTLWRASQVSLFHPKWEKKKQLKDLRFNAQLLGCRTAVWQNASAA